MKETTKKCKVSISAGNSKMGAIPSVSLPPIVTCPAGTPCAKKCYAARMCKRYPNVKNAYNNNMDILISDPGKYWNDIRATVKMSRYFRFHVSGDIPDGVYFYDMVITARENPHCEILAFTKQYDIVKDYLRRHGGKLPENLHIVFSLWDPVWNLRVKNPYDLPMSAVIFKGKSVENYSKVCPGNCFECACRGIGCWTLQAGETIAFPEH